MEKITRFKDIPQYTRAGSYNVDVSLDYLESHLAHFEKTILGNHSVKFDLNPDFQRGHVWTQAKQVSYVEFLLRGGKSARTLYFNCPGWMHSFKGPMQIVDGKQRLEACRAFLRNEFRVFGSYFTEFEDPRCLMFINLTFNVNDLKTRAEVLQWYLDLNAGGVVHTDEEIQIVRRLLEAEKK